MPSTITVGWVRKVSADIFGLVVFSTDPRGRLVTVTLMFASVIIGSIPRMGKTFSLRSVS